MRLRHSIAFVAFALILNLGCSSDSDTVKATTPFTVSGQVRDLSSNISIEGCLVSLPGVAGSPTAWTDVNGFYRIEQVPAGSTLLRVEAVGYEMLEATIPAPINGIATVNPLMQKKQYSVPLTKPLSTGRVRLRAKILETDFDGDGQYSPFHVRGAAYSPAPIGSWGPVSDPLHDRSLQMLAQMNANTIRTYSGASPYLLQRAADHNIRVIVGYWVPLEIDLSDQATRDDIILDFQRMVLQLKDYPSVLMWNLGNEQNYSSNPNNGNSAYWYTLVQDLAVAAYLVEGATYHPVCGSNGGLFNIGSAALRADDASLTYMDLWGANIYEVNFSTVFAAYRQRTGKAIVVTEFGIDALDNRTKTVYETVQAQYDSTNWVQIAAANDVCVGATVFEFTDEWWKAGDPSTHDDGGYATTRHPDGYSNEEWWGVVAVTPDVNGDGMDEWRARPVYHVFQNLWK